ncbi:MAG: DUF5591 domain-containing protein [Thermoplasmatales archaeon]|nr:DUF5591 domain-containing protein [Thermoplasmatales archaeon]MCW6171093.1 DUF5591 domain-containing protein [Thermoplasmatales archaeon]
MFIDHSFFGFARSGVLNDNVEYPALLIPDRDISCNNSGLSVLGEKRISAMQFVMLLKGNSTNSLIPQEDYVIIPNGSQLLLKARDIINTINAARDKYGYSKLVYLQGVSDPYLLPILVYMGVSLFDSSLFELRGLKGERFTPIGIVKTNSDVSQENVNFCNNLLRSVSTSIANGTLRDVVERFQFSNKASEILRILDSKFYSTSEQFFPRRTPRISASSLDSLNRPDLVRYREYISKSYRKPEDRNIALLLPCSARKPYSSSKSHKMIINALGKLRQFVHEVIVTSPVGLVPRELEATYPPGFYDIPVTGNWFEEEKQMISSMLGSFFKNNNYTRVISFVTEDLSFIEKFLPTRNVFIRWDKSSNASLDELVSTIREIISAENLQPIRHNFTLERYIQIATYQFGEWIVPYLKEAKIKRIYNSDMLMLNGDPILVYNERLGKFTINKRSAQWFLENKKFCVEIDDFKPTANVYPVGILGATEDIRQEDEVVLYHGGEVRGVGITKMPINAMLQLKKGTAVKVRN